MFKIDKVNKEKVRYHKMTQIIECGKFKGYPSDSYRFVQQLLIERLQKDGEDFELIDPPEHARWVKISTKPPKEGVKQTN
jgi:hypothetical protein